VNDAKVEKAREKALASDWFFSMVSSHKSKSRNTTADVLGGPTANRTFRLRGRGTQKKTERAEPSVKKGLRKTRLKPSIKLEDGELVLNGSGQTKSSARKGGRMGPEGALMKQRNVLREKKSKKGRLAENRERKCTGASD